MVFQTGSGDVICFIFGEILFWLQPESQIDVSCNNSRYKSKVDFFVFSERPRGVGRHDQVFLPGDLFEAT